MDAKCPHCKKTIDLVGARELDADFSIGSNHVQHARERGTFPEPWLAFGNRMIYLRRDIEAYVSDREGATARKAVELLKKTLSPQQLEKVMQELSSV
jgi:hypothetical protein